MPTDGQSAKTEASLKRLAEALRDGLTGTSPQILAALSQLLTELRIDDLRAWLCLLDDEDNPRRIVAHPITDPPGPAVELPDPQPLLDLWRDRHGGYVEPDALPAIRHDLSATAYAVPFRAGLLLCSTPDRDAAARREPPLHRAIALLSHDRQRTPESCLRRAEDAVRSRIARIQDSRDLAAVLSEIHFQLEVLGIDVATCSLQILNDSGTDFVSCVTKVPGREGIWGAPFKEQALRDLGWTRRTDNLEMYPWVLTVWRSGAPQVHPDTSGMPGMVPGWSVVDVAFSHGTLAIATDRTEAYGSAETRLLARLAGIVSDGFQRFVDTVAHQRAQTLVQAQVQLQGSVLALRQEGDLRGVLRVLCDGLHALGVDVASCRLVVAGGSGAACSHDCESSPRALTGTPPEPPAVPRRRPTRAEEAPARSVLELDCGDALLALYGDEEDAFSDGDVEAAALLSQPLAAGLLRLRDLTEREARARLATAASTLREAVWRMESLEDAPLLLDALQRALADVGIDFAHSGVNLLDDAPDGQTRFFHFRSARWEPGSRERGQLTIRDIWRAGSVAYRPDLDRDDPWQERDRLRVSFGEPIRSIVDVPFSRGTVAVNSTRAHAFSDADIALLREVTGQLDDVLTAGFQRLQDLEAVRASQQQFERTAAHVQDILYSVDAQTHEFRYLSPAFARLTGFAEADIAAAGGRLPFLFEHTVDGGPAQPGVRYDTLRDHPDPGARFVDELCFRCRDGRRLWLEDSWGPVYEGDRLISFDGVLRDVTERRRSERDLRVQLSLQRVRDAIHEMEDEEGWSRVLQTIVDELRTHMDFDYAGINIVDLEAGTFVPTLNYRHDSPHPARPLTRSMRWTLESGAAVYRSTRREIEAWGDRMSANITCVVDVPWAAGTLGVSAEHEHAFTDDDIAILQRFADVLSEGQRRRLDLSRLRDKEEEQRQGQKLEVIGQLAGGVAHDFNNLLTAIMTSADMLLPTSEGAAREGLRTILTATERAADLTQQLLAFGRRQRREPEDLELSDAVDRVTEIVQRLIGEEITLVARLSSEPIHVRADRSQLEQIILNLAVNGRDAMPEGGTLTIETGTERSAGGADALPAGDYAVLRIRDTGVGMAPEVRDRIFEPFYTTKERGRGTGLGLSTVYGIVMQSDGAVRVDTQPGAGTTFTIHLPRFRADGAPAAGMSAAGAVDTAPASPAAAPASATILMVEDEGAVRDVLAQALADAGYRCLAAADPEAALRIWAEAAPDIDVVLLDVVMPGMRGPELLARLRQDRADLPAVLMSGYASPTDRTADALFVQKPLSLQRLLRALRQAISVAPRTDG